MQASSLQTDHQAMSRKAMSTGKTLVLAKLSADSKQRVWSYLVEHNQELASNLQKASEDKVVKTLLEQFDGSLTIDITSIPVDLRDSLTYIQ